MHVIQESSRFIWLTTMVDQQKRHIASLLSRLAIFDGQGKRKPALAEKFHELLHQIELEREKEFELICEIQDVEDKHRYHREHDELEKANPDFSSDEGVERKRKSFWQFLSFLRCEDGANLCNEKQWLIND